jgi:acyl-CoA synthetase (AMP-forming)/AMP-acid ligase II
LVHLYGLTEAGPSGLMVPPERHGAGLARIGAYGMPVGTRGFNEWISWRIADSDGEPVPAGEVGSCHRSSRGTGSDRRGQRR